MRPIFNLTLALAGAFLASCASVDVDARKSAASDESFDAVAISKFLEPVGLNKAVECTDSLGTALNATSSYSSVYKIEGTEFERKVLARNFAYNRLVWDAYLENNFDAKDIKAERNLGGKLALAMLGVPTVNQYAEKARLEVEIPKCVAAADAARAAYNSNESVSNSEAIK